MDLFEQAAREKFRFSTPQGSFTVEELWDMPLTARSGSRTANLDDLAKALNKQAKAAAEDESFVRRTKKKDTSAQTMLDIVKHVIEVRLAEEDAAAEALRRKDEKQKILAIIDRKENATLEASSIEELRKRLAEL